MNAEFSLGPFCNWFLPSCLDIWSSNDGKQVIFGYGARSSLCLCDISTNNNSIQTRDSINVFNSNKPIISCIKFAKKGSICFQTPYLFIGSSDGESALINCQTNQITHQKVDITELSLPSKKILSADWSQTKNGLVVYYSIHSVIIEWNINTGKLKYIKLGDNYVNKIAISCISSSNCGREKLAIGYMNGDITIQYIDDFDHHYRVEQNLSGHNDDICSLSLSYTKGQYEEGILASISRDGFVKVWDIDRKAIIADTKLDAMKVKSKNWFSLAILPIIDNSNKFEVLIGSGNGNLLTIEIPVKPPGSKIRVHKPLIFNTCKTLSHSSVIFSIAIDINTMLAITSSLDHQIIVWDLKERKGLNTFHTFSHGAHDISISPIDPTLLAIAIGDGVEIIKFSDDSNIKYQRRHIIFKSKEDKGLSVVWHPEYEHRLAVASSSGDICVVDIKSSQLLHKYSTVKSHYDRSKVYGLIWGPPLDGSQGFILYCVHQSGNIFLHKTSENTISNFTDYVKDKKKRSEIKWKTSFSHLAVGNEDGTVEIFEHKDKKLDLVLKIKAYNKAILCLEWNSNVDEETSNWLAVSSYSNDINCYSLNDYFNGNYDQIVSTDSVITISKANRVLKSHLERITSMSWCPFDSNKLVSVSYDRTAQIWDVSNQSPLTNFRGHRGILFSVKWSPFDEDLIFSGGEDNYFHAWRPSKQSFTTPHALNGFDDHSSKTRDQFDWPHLEDNNETEGNTNHSVSRVLERCIDQIVSETTPDANYSSVNNGFSNEEFNKQKQKSKIKVSKKRTNKENKKISLFLLSNAIENNSTKYQKIEDIETLFEKLKKTNLSVEKSERVLLYGDCDDIKLFIKNEILNHEKYGNKEQKDILNLLLDIKSTLQESIERMEMNSHLVALSMSVSRNLWKESVKVFAQQLANSNDTETETYKFYKIEMSSIFSLSLNDIKGAIDLLLKNELYREALIIAKLRFESDEVIEHIMTLWANYRENNNDFEGAAKCLIAINKFNDASALLYKRNDQQYNHTACLLQSKQ